MGRSVVVAMGSLLVSGACNKGGTEIPTSNPPAAPAPPAPEPVVAAPAAPAPVVEGVLNGVHPEHGRIYRNADGTCRVNLPIPPANPADGPPPSFRPPPTQVVDCPVHMADPTWSECLGTVTTGPEAGQCLCAVIGNPPPPPRAIACPKTEG